MFFNCTHQNSPGKIVSVRKPEPQAVFITVKGSASEVMSPWQDLGLKHKDPKATACFPA